MQPGVVVAGKYRIESVLGRGAMGLVVAAMHLDLEQRVALKFLLGKLTEDAVLIERFAREARASAQLRGEHVCRVSDFGRLEDGVPYIVMELLDGGDLATLVDTDGPLSVERASDYALQACVGLAEAHALGIIHRDLKPANLFLTRRPDGTELIKVVDFGIAKAECDEAAFQLTQTNTLLGSPAYMSPEQLRSGRAANVRSDIWALGVILYELIAGRTPFTGDTLTALAVHITMDPPPPLAGTPPEFEAIVHRCLAKEPADRYPDLASLTAALAPFGGPDAMGHAEEVARLLALAPVREVRSAAVSSSATFSSTTHPEAGAAPAPTTFTGAASELLTPDPMRRRWRRVALTCVVGAAVSAAIVPFVAMNRGSSPQREPTRAPTVAPAAITNTPIPPERESTAPAPPAPAAAAVEPAAAEPAAAEPTTVPAPALAQPVRGAASPKAPRTGTRGKPAPKDPSVENLSDSRF